MRTLSLTLALTLAIAPAAWADHAKDGPGGWANWPNAGPFVTVLMMLPNGAPVCVAGLKAVPLASAGGATMGYTIWTQAASTHLYVSYEGARAPDANAVVVYDHGQAIAELPVLSRQVTGTSISYMADLSGDLWNRVVAPRISGGGVELGVGDLRLPIPGADFKQGADYRAECLARMQAAKR